MVYNNIQNCINQTNVQNKSSNGNIEVSGSLKKEKFGCENEFKQLFALVVPMETNQSIY